MGKGGLAYTGKIYCPGYDASISREQFISSVRGIEILSMGIQRMLESPVDFQRQDPDFIISSNPSYHDFNPFRTCQNG